jgi:Xaa-Pro aminopeptidase
MTMKRLVIVGDTLLDRDVDGAVRRIAPDAPAPVLDLAEERVRAGGAGLAARLAAADGVRVTLVTSVAADADGERLRAALPDRAVAAPPLVEQLREVKDDAELAAMAAAARIGCETLAAVLGELHAGVTEREVAVALEVGMRRRGADGPAFDSIVAFGEQAAEPHHHPGDRPLGRGDLVKLDFGARVDGYCSDMTRTVVLGRASGRQRELHGLVQAAQAAGLDALRAGVAAGQVDRACRQPLEAAGLGEAFSHPTGHGVGLEIHEAPRVRPDADGRIAAGTPVTVEPGVYLPGFGGIRIEDLAVVRGDGHQLLTTAPKDLLEL